MAFSEANALAAMLLLAGLVRELHAVFTLQDQSHHSPEG
jgi:hypothetical protein